MGTDSNRPVDIRHLLLITGKKIIFMKEVNTTLRKSTILLKSLVFLQPVTTPENRNFFL